MKKYVLVLIIIITISCNDKKQSKDDLNMNVSYNYLMSVYRLGYAKGRLADRKSIIEAQKDSTKSIVEKFEKYETKDTLEYGKEIRLIINQQNN